MIVLGLLLIVLAGAAVIAVSWDEAATSTATASFTVFDRTFQLSQLEFFFAGVVTGAVLLLGIALMLAGMRHAAARRRRLRDSRLEARDRVARLEEEKRELERKLQESPDPTATTPATAPAAAPVSRDRDRDRDGVDDRDEPTAPHPRVDVPRQSGQSNDQLVAGRHQRTSHHR
ncbi:hypothetical protein [Planomonospora parontospora]|uniref:hypothetical protein n=1 Tax=Planomonospora parontospora TaxID=58119 RepID=UPI00166FB240|nr:hypothetical protein [Planomonospora parontospora]GGL37123.1 hypothetical protein GCM10014719_42840 [Planomonospora parontospora subsp. antibiotica]GII17281.1 hypothetical protein Ppa05_40070 [Planomonospora parontospora subsp. antibiotica]